MCRAHALQTVVQLMGEREMYDFWSDTYKVHHVDWTQEKAALVLETWQRRFSEVSNFWTTYTYAEFCQGGFIINIV